MNDIYDKASLALRICSAVVGMCRRELSFQRRIRNFHRGLIAQTIPKYHVVSPERTVERDKIG